MEKYLKVGCPSFIYLERTLALIKPDAVDKESEIVDVILNHGFTIALVKNYKFTKNIFLLIFCN